MQAITTRWLPPTNTRPSRIKAECEAGSLVISWDYQHGASPNHARAAMELQKKLGWLPHGGMIGGEPKTPRGGVMVWVFDKSLTASDLAGGGRFPE